MIFGVARFGSGEAMSQGHDSNETNGDCKICRSDPQKCEKLKRCLQQMMNQSLVQIGYSKKIKDVSAIESQGHL